MTDMPKRKMPDVPWLTKEGYIDMSRVPIDGTLRDAAGPNRQRARDAIGVLGSCAHAGRTDAGMFLMGLLLSTADSDLERRADIVRALQSHATQPCATLLFGELRRVKSSNTTRTYLDEVIDALRRFPGEIVEDGFDDLAADTSFTPRMREKFRRAAGQTVDRRGDDEDDDW